MTAATTVAPRGLPTISSLAGWRWLIAIGTVSSGGLTPLVTLHLGRNGAATELHGSDMLSGRNAFRRIPAATREALFQAVLAEVGARTNSLSAFFVVVHKDSVPVTRNVRTLATLQLYQRFNAYLSRVGAYRKRSQEHGMLVCDDHASRGQIQALMSVIHSGGVPKQLVDNLIETAFFTDSRQSRLLQVADLLCHATYRFIEGRDCHYFHEFERKIDRNLDPKRKTRRGKPQMVHYGFRYVATGPEVGLEAPLQFKYLDLSATTRLPVGSFLEFAQFEAELRAHRL